MESDTVTVNVYWSSFGVWQCRVEPKGESDTFIVHGQACSTSRAHPTCTHDPTSKKLPGGRSYTIDISDIMGSDLPVRHPNSGWSQFRFLCGV